MMLGDVLAAARDSGAGIETWLKPADPDLWDALQAEAGRRHAAPAEIVRMAMAGFSDRAAEEDWAALISRMRDAEDPGRALVMTHLRWWLGAPRVAASFAAREDTR